MIFSCNSCKSVSDNLIVLYFFTSSINSFKTLCFWSELWLSVWASYFGYDFKAEMVSWEAMKEKMYSNILSQQRWSMKMRRNDQQHMCVRWWKLPEEDAKVCPITARSWMATSEKKVSIVAILLDIVCLTEPHIRQGFRWWCQIYSTA